MTLLSTTTDAFLLIISVSLYTVGDRKEEREEEIRSNVPHNF